MDRMSTSLLDQGPLTTPSYTESLKVALEQGNLLISVAIAASILQELNGQA
jgi:hypothetical protein